MQAPNHFLSNFKTRGCLFQRRVLIFWSMFFCLDSPCFCCSTVLCFALSSIVNLNGYSKECLRHQPPMNQSQSQQMQWNNSYKSQEDMYTSNEKNKLFWFCLGDENLPFSERNWWVIHVIHYMIYKSLLLEGTTISSREPWSFLLVEMSHKRDPCFQG